MRIWIIGKFGMVAEALSCNFKNKGICFCATSRKEVDICDIDAIRTWYQYFRPTHTINVAAYTAVDEAEEEIAKAYAINAYGVENIARILQEEGGRLIHISTDYVFSGENIEGYSEKDLPMPQNIYGKTKYEGEQIIQLYLPEATILRTSWVISSNKKNFFTTMRKLMMEQAEISVVSDQIGRPTLAGDLTEAIIFLLGHSGVFHFANRGVASWFTLAQEIYSCLQFTQKLQCKRIVPILSRDYPSKALRPKCSVLNTQKIEKYGLQIRHWKRGLCELLC